MSDKKGPELSYDRPIFGGADGRSRPTGGAGSSVPHKRRRRLSLQAKMFLFAVVALAVIAGAATFYLRPKESKYVLDNYQIATIGTRDFRNVYFSAGRIVPDDVVTPVSPTSRSQVQHVHIEAGDHVTAGQVLMELFSEDLTDDLSKVEGEWMEASIELAQARLQAEQDNAAKERELEQAQNDLVDAEETFHLLQSLYEQGGIAKRELDQAHEDVARRQVAIETAQNSLTFTQQRGELAVRKAEQKLMTSEKQLASLKEQVEGLTVRSEIDGRVLSVDVRVGDTLAQGVQLAQIADLTKQHVNASITPEQALEVRPGMQALLRFGSHAVPAVVGFVSPQATTTNDGSVVAIRLDLDPEIAETLVPNTEVSIEIELGMRADKTAVQRGPFFASGDASFVYVVSDDGLQAHRRDVRFGAIDGSVIEVVEGLEPGERIIYSSYSAFRAYPTVELLPEGGRNVEWP